MWRFSITKKKYRTPVKYWTVPSLVLVSRDDADHDPLNISTDAMSVTNNGSMMNTINNEASTSASQQVPLDSSVDTVSAPSIARAMKQEPIFEEMNDRDANAVENFLNDSYEKNGSDEDLYIHKKDYLPAPIAEKASPYEVKKMTLSQARCLSQLM